MNPVIVLDSSDDDETPPKKPAPKFVTSKVQATIATATAAANAQLPLRVRITPALNAFPAATASDGIPTAGVAAAGPLKLPGTPLPRNIAKITPLRPVDTRPPPSAPPLQQQQKQQVVVGVKKPASQYSAEQHLQKLEEQYKRNSVEKRRQLGLLTQAARGVPTHVAVPPPTTLNTSSCNSNNAVAPPLQQRPPAQRSAQRPSQTLPQLHPKPEAPPPPPLAKRQLQLQPQQQQQQLQQQHQQQQHVPPKRKRSPSITLSPRPLDGGSSHTVVPVISSVHSIVADAQPPLQLLAPVAKRARPITNLPSNNNNGGQNNKNVDNFKILLPPKTTLKAIPSPVPAAMSTPSTEVAAATVPPPVTARNGGATARRVQPLTILGKTDAAWQAQKRQPRPVQRGEVDIEMIAPQIHKVMQQRRRTQPATEPRVMLKNDLKQLWSRLVPQLQNGPQPPPPEAPKNGLTTAPPATTTSETGRSTGAPRTPVYDLTLPPFNLSEPSMKTLPRPPPSEASPPPPPLAAFNCIRPRNVPAIIDLEHLDGAGGDDCDVIDLGHLTNEKKLKAPTSVQADKEPAAPEPAPLVAEFEDLLVACRGADPSADMERLISSKLLKYYHEVHADFVRSRGFRKNVRGVSARIRAEPDLVYLHLKAVVDELKVRRRSNTTANAHSEDANSEEGGNCSGSGGGGGAAGDQSVVTGNKRTDAQIRKLNKALYILTKRIEVMEEAEVDWDAEDSTYLQVERFKKRACQIYEKICDLTGESKNAHRLVKKPIQIKVSPYPQFNKTLQAYINRTREFPDYFDVLRMLEHCNTHYKLELHGYELRSIAQDAFLKVGKQLQSRRKTDLYETVSHFTSDSRDPAAEDPVLLAKLSENLKQQTKISDVIEKYARRQDLSAGELREARLKEKLKSQSKAGAEPPPQAEAAVPPTSAPASDEDDEDDEDDDEEEEEEEEEEDANKLAEEVEKLANVEISDVESDADIKICADKDLRDAGPSKSTPSTGQREKPTAISVIKANVLLQPRDVGAASTPVPSPNAATTQGRGGGAVEGGGVKQAKQRRPNSEANQIL